MSRLSKFVMSRKHMAVNIIVFGQLTDITGSPLSVDNVADTDSLVKELNKLYPSLRDKKYAIAVNKKLVTANTILTNESIVALMPPFSGG